MMLVYGVQFLALEYSMMECYRVILPNQQC